MQAEFPAIPIGCDFDTSLPEFEADPEQLTQALLNVVKNAAQALAWHDGGARHPAPGRAWRVASRWRSAATGWRSWWRSVDNGPGVAPEIRDKIFYPLVSGREGGSGLGLTIAQTFVAQHGGNNRMR